MVQWLLRGLFGIIIIGLATAALVDLGKKNADTLGMVAFGAVLLTGVAALALDMVVRRKQITTISAVYFGLLAGLLIGNLFTKMTLEPFNILESGDARTSYLVSLLGILITMICCYLLVSVLLQTKDEFRFVIPYVEFSRQSRGGRPLVLDTSVIIDGRIADICDTRIIDAKMIVARFVLQELQAVADSGDKLKRNRGRRGLDMLKRMQGNTKVELQVHDADYPSVRAAAKVDERLVFLAKELNGRVVTNDYNLNKIAQLQGVEVINLNELANALKSVALPGEQLIVRVVKPGDQMGQGVGYLEDGTMVVIEQGKSHVGQEVAVSVTSVLQTPAGRMIFGRVEPRTAPPPDKEKAETA